MWRATVLTLFPEFFPGPLAASLIGKALQERLWDLEIRDIRVHGLGRHRTVDDAPSGGGPGMVMRVDVAASAIDAALADDTASRPLIYLSPRGKPLNQSRVRELASGTGVILFCGRFEGLDQRAIEARNMEEISLGDFVLAGGEIAAMALLESCVRLIPGVIGSSASQNEESFEQGLLEYPHYTRPQVFEGAEIPPVLNSGNHEEIARWRKEQAETLTRAKRPDLWTLYEKLCRSARTPGPPKKSRRTGGKHEPDPNA